ARKLRTLGIAPRLWSDDESLGLSVALVSEVAPVLRDIDVAIHAPDPLFGDRLIGLVHENLVCRVALNITCSTSIRCDDFHLLADTTHRVIKAGFIHKYLPIIPQAIAEFGLWRRLPK